jgi:hypothetical protein
MNDRKVKTKTAQEFLDELIDECFDMALFLQDELKNRDDIHQINSVENTPNKFVSKTFTFWSNTTPYRITVENRRFQEFLQ